MNCEKKNLKKPHLLIWTWIIGANTHFFRKKKIQNTQHYVINLQFGIQEIMKKKKYTYNALICICVKIVKRTVYTKKSPPYKIQMHPISIFPMESGVCILRFAHECWASNLFTIVNISIDLYETTQHRMRIQTFSVQFLKLKRRRKNEINSSMLTYENCSQNRILFIQSQASNRNEVIMK